ncbi:3-deoxy-D-manno-octulosonic acid transferase [Parabacteroides sp. OttesenSCG-928-J18]|nr:3-deoxy-D-manno-octulosonic acid transferase [Parabacteroides sp. OttesenSCG-928-J18]
MFYSLLIHLYSFLIELAAPFHKKARLMRLGQWKTNSILREKIDRNAKYIWFHAASLGEFEQGRPMMEKIKADYPQYKILLTFFSPSGYEVRKNYEGADVICYLPFDSPYKVKKFIHLANPAMAIFIKYEFWANYLHELRRNHIPTYIISAIFRPEQLFFKWYGRGYRKVLRYFDHLFVQDDQSLQLLQKYGITNVTVAGDTRFDRVWDVYNRRREIPHVEQFVDQAKANGQRILVAGSSWPQDEAIFIEYFNNQPDIRLIIAPHEIHREHLMHIEALLKRSSIRLSDGFARDKFNRDCIIVDSFGMLSSIYRYADIAYIGGGFGAGIHNTLEAAVYGIPVLFGPKYQKFKEARDLIAIGGAFSITKASEFDDRMNDLLTYNELREEAGKAAGQFVSEHTGGTQKILAALPL